jgi:ribosomal protein S18
MGRKKTHEEFIKTFEEFGNKTIRIIDKYSNVKTKMKCQCLLCGEYFYLTSSCLFRGYGHRECSIKNRTEKITKSNEKFIEELLEVNSDIEVLEKYINSKTKIECRCNICNNIWSSKPSHLLTGSGCPKCRFSKGEMKIRKYLENNSLSYSAQHKCNNLLGINNGKLSYDFYLSAYNLLIEYQGKFHDGTADIQNDKGFEIQKEHDRRKQKYAFENNIKLLEIWYWDFDNIEEILSRELGVKSSSISM